MGIRQHSYRIHLDLGVHRWRILGSDKETAHGGEGRGGGVWFSRRKPSAEALGVIFLSRQEGADVRARKRI